MWEWENEKQTNPQSEMPMIMGRHVYSAERGSESERESESIQSMENVCVKIWWKRFTEVEKMGGMECWWMLVVRWEEGALRIAFEDGILNFMNMCFISCMCVCHHRSVFSFLLNIFNYYFFARFEALLHIVFYE